MKNYLLAIAFVLAANIVSAQQADQHCQAHEHLQNQLADPQQRLIYEQTQQRMNEWLLLHPEGNTTRTTVYIPVIFHVVYTNAAGNVPVQRLYEQIQILNEDFGGYNADYTNTPGVWQPISGNTDIQFCLAQIDPQGNWTPGYEYIQTTSSPCQNSILFAAAPGWNPNDYLNIWVAQCNNGLLGYASFPGSASATEDGVVIMHNFVGKTGAQAPYNLGRTGTHEVGPWLDLYHISGDDGNNCTGDDQVADTPLQTDQTYGYNAPNTVITDACSPAAPGVMWMNYMNYCDDTSMYMFTMGQKARMWAALNGPRSGILSSTKCVPTSVHNFADREQPAVFPNPTTDRLTIEIPAGFGAIQQITIVSVTGANVMQIAQPAIRENRLELDISQLSEGIYFVELYATTGRSVSKVVRN